MLAIIGVVTSLIMAVAGLLVAVSLYKLRSPIGAALMMCAMKATGKKLSSLVKLTKDGTTIFPSAEELLHAALQSDEQRDQTRPLPGTPSYSPMSLAIRYKLQATQWPALGRDVMQLTEVARRTDEGAK